MKFQVYDFSWQLSFYEKCTPWLCNKETPVLPFGLHLVLLD